MPFAEAMLVRRGYFIAALVVLLLDQATKVAAHHWLQGVPPVEVVPGLFSLIYTRNPGGLFGYFGELAQPWRGLLLTAMPLLAVGMIVHFIVRADDLLRSTRFGLALILGGALGNLLDRVVRGEVVDFLDVYAPTPALADWFVRRFGTSHWPTFNVADSAIVCGAGLLLLDILRAPRAAEQSADPQAQAKRPETD